MRVSPEKSRSRARIPHAKRVGLSPPRALRSCLRAFKPLLRHIWSPLSFAQRRFLHDWSLLRRKRRLRSSPESSRHSQRPTFSAWNLPPLSLLPRRVPRRRPLSLLPLRVPRRRPLSLLPRRVPRRRQASRLPLRVPRRRQASRLPRRVPRRRPPRHPLLLESRHRAVWSRHLPRPSRRSGFFRGLRQSSAPTSRRLSLSRQDSRRHVRLKQSPHRSFRRSRSLHPRPSGLRPPASQLRPHRSNERRRFCSLAPRRRPWRCSASRWPLGSRRQRVIRPG